MRLPYRIGIPARPPVDGIGLRSLIKRGTDNTQAKPYIIVVAVCAGAAVLAFAVWVLFRLRKATKLRAGYHKRYRYDQANGNDDSSAAPGARPARTRAGGNASSQTTGGGANMTSAVDRNTSVRSIMTLPAYRTKANDNEQVLGREGERDGVDVVVDMPSVEEHEALREDEMETLYQIRLARQDQIAQRDERRQLRREARSRGDMVALRELSERARAASQSHVVEDLREEQQRLRTQRSRAVSSVSYEQLGVVSHDGTRLRANSQESERRGLLSDAASIALSARSPSAISHRLSDAALSVRSPSALSHRRERSASSVLSFDSTQDFPSPGNYRSGAPTPRRLSAQHVSTAGSSPEIIGEADLGELEMPSHDPPRYDDVSLEDARSGATTPINFNEPPPNYPGPYRASDRRLSAQVAGMIDNVGADGDLSTAPSSRVSRNSSSSSSRPVPFPRLPSLSLDSIPQIVVEPSSAYPREHSRDR